MKRLVILALASWNICAMHTPQLLIKLATRERPHKVFKTLDAFYSKRSFAVPVTFVVSCDEDDATMNNPTTIKRLSSYPDLYFYFSPAHSKIEAINRDLDKHPFDILLVVHDDMEPVVSGYDTFIVDLMMAHFPDFDGVLNLNDGFVGGRCNTIPVIGSSFYKRFGYVYHPSYKALVGNEELTCVSKILRKEVVVDQVLIKHNHPAWGIGVADGLYNRNEKHHKGDRNTFIKRRATFFDLDQKEIDQASTKMWSILICTIKEREEQFEKLYTKIKAQIAKAGLGDQVEVLVCSDKRGENTIGAKRNRLLAQSCGQYVSFIDDDDDIHSEYVAMLYEKMKDDPDCISLQGIITFNGQNPKKFIHSVKHKAYFERNNCYFRPPNHLNPIKRSIAAQFSFAEKNFGEDTDWALTASRSGLLKNEQEVETPYYFYQYVY